MKYEIGDKVKVFPGIYFRGYNLSNKIGIVKDTDSYILVFFADINLTAKMLTDEIEYYLDPDEWYYKTEW